MPEPPRTSHRLPQIADRQTWQAEIDELRVKDKGGQFQLDGRPTAQWSRIKAGRNDDLGTAPGEQSGQHSH